MSASASIHKNKKTTLGRIKCFISKGPVSKDQVSLNKISGGIPSLANSLYSDSLQFSSLEHWQLPGPNGSWQKYSFDKIVSQEFAPAKLGQCFGPIWSTHLFKVTFLVPASWSGKEVHLRWNSGSEATLWDTTGSILGAFSPHFRDEYVLSKSWVPKSDKSDEEITFYIEMACNGMFGGMEGENLNIGPPDPDFTYTLQLVDIAVFEPAIFKLFTDIEMLYGMATELPDDDHRGYQAMYTANEMINLIAKMGHDEASQLADKFFSEKNGQKAHTLVAMGHCHIDTAWLWPYDETIRKCARSWRSQIELMKQYPDFVFTCSQAQQFYWIKKYYPELYLEIKEYVSKGRFIPVGGTWVEMDGLLPSGESFIRQFYYGQRFFKEEFGIRCKEFWLPDTFGYSGQIPQIMKHVGIDRFLTQKLSWSIVNKFPHHNFIWEAIDGSQVLVHFPPGDCYTMTASVNEILKSVRNSQDKGRANIGAYLFGHGDGGGGPTRTMIERLNRVMDVDGLPKIVMESPDYFFKELAKEQNKLCKWVGELYLELHNGTYTSQAKIKWYNRKSEQLLKEVELLVAIGYSSGLVEEESIKRDLLTIDKCWKKVLLNQFHDVIPGSCIELVKDDAWRIYESVFAKLTTLRTSYHHIMLGSKGNKHLVLYNPLPWDINTVVFSNSLTKGEYSPGEIQEVTLEEKGFDNNQNENDTNKWKYKLPSKFCAARVKLGASGYSKFSPESVQPMELGAKATPFFDRATTLINNKLILRVDYSNGIPHEHLTFRGKDGEDIQIFKTKSQPITNGVRVQPGMFYIYDDVPLFWDAWDCMDYHLETKKEVKCDHQTIDVVAEGPVVAAYKWRSTFGNNSALTRYTILRAGSPMLEYLLVVDWNESHKFLKVEFPVDILARDATYEIQYGHLKRPTHINTSWDMAKFEVSGHKWMDISQADKGVTFITDSKYGWHVRDNIVQLSLLRSPKSPDGNCDMHRHFIHYAVLPHEGSFQEADAIRLAYEFNFLGANNIPVMQTDKDIECLPTNWVTVSNKAVIVEAVKVAPDRKRTLCIRLYESFGGFAKTTVMFGFGVQNIEECNGLEEPLPEDKQDRHLNVGENSFQLSLNPFQIKSFLVTFLPNVFPFKIVSKEKL